jgi:hypothetical protein
MPESEQSYVVQATRANPDCGYFVDCSDPLNYNEAQRRAQQLREPKCWINGMVGKVRLVAVEDSNCFEACKHRGLCE